MLQYYVHRIKTIWLWCKTKTPLALLKNLIAAILLRLPSIIARQTVRLIWLVLSFAIGLPQAALCSIGGGSFKQVMSYLPSFPFEWSWSLFWKQVLPLPKIPEIIQQAVESNLPAVVSTPPKILYSLSPLSPEMIAMLSKQGIYVLPLATTKSSFSFSRECFIDAVSTEAFSGLTYPCVATIVNLVCGFRDEWLVNSTPLWNFIIATSLVGSIGAIGGGALLGIGYCFGLPMVAGVMANCSVQAFWCYWLSADFFHLWSECSLSQILFIKGAGALSGAWLSYRLRQNYPRPSLNQSSKEKKNDLSSADEELT